MGICLELLPSLSLMLSPFWEPFISASADSSSTSPRSTVYFSSEPLQYVIRTIKYVWIIMIRSYVTKELSDDWTSNTFHAPLQSRKHMKNSGAHLKKFRCIPENSGTHLKKFRCTPEKFRCWIHRSHIIRGLNCKMKEGLVNHDRRGLRFFLVFDLFSIFARLPSPLWRLRHFTTCCSKGSILSETIPIRLERSGLASSRVLLEP